MFAFSVEKPVAVHEPILHKEPVYILDLILFMVMWFGGRFANLFDQPEVDTKFIGMFLLVATFQTRKNYSLIFRLR